MDLGYLSPLPDETARAAEAVLGTENPYLRIGRRAAALLAEGLQNASLAGDAPPPEAGFAVLALATLLQSAEKLTDRQMSYATCTRLDLKYALHLPLHFPGFSSARLCQFRQSLLTAPERLRRFQAVAAALASEGLVQCEAGSLAQAADMLAEICALSRLEKMVEAFHQALEAAAAHHADWLRDILLPRWYRQYASDHNALSLPRQVQAQAEMARELGEDARYFLQHAAQSPEIERLSEVQNLRNECVRQYEPCPDGSFAWRACCCPFAED